MEIAGLPVKDASKALKIKITSNDIKKGDSKNAGMCAAAQAIIRQTEATDARVHVGRTYVKMDDKWLRFETPPALRAGIIAFDRGGSFEPGEYELKKLRASHYTGGKRQGSAPRLSNARKNPTRKARRKHVVTGIRHNGANR